MNDYTNVIRPFVVIPLVIVMYIFVMQLSHDPVCAMLDTDTAPTLGERLIKFVSLCWW